MIGALSQSTTEQVSAVRGLAAALANVSEMSHSISAATEHLSTMDRELERLMSQFTIGGGAGSGGEVAARRPAST
jgi:methyl-accepting chemotaxis protein